MSCANPSSAFLRAWLEHPELTEEQHNAMLRQIEFIDKMLKEDDEESLSSWNENDKMLASWGEVNHEQLSENNKMLPSWGEVNHEPSPSWLNGTNKLLSPPHEDRQSSVISPQLPSEPTEISGSQAHQSQYDDDISTPEKPMLRGGGDTVDRAIYDHQNAVDAAGGPDKSKLAKVQVLAEGDPLLTWPKNDAKLANTQYLEAEQMLEFFGTVFRHVPMFRENKLKCSYHFGKEFIGGLWVTAKEHACFGDGNIYYGNAALCKDVIYHEIAHGVIYELLGFRLKKSGDRDEQRALWEHFADVFVLLKKRHDDPESENWLIGEGFFNPRLGCKALRDMLHPGTAWKYTKIDGQLRKDTSKRHMVQIGAARDYYDMSTIPSHAFALITKAIGHEQSGLIWWEAISNLDENNDKHLTFHDFAKKTLQAADDQGMDGSPIRKGWRGVGLQI